MGNPIEKCECDSPMVPRFAEHQLDAVRVVEWNCPRCERSVPAAAVMPFDAALNLVTQVALQLRDAKT